MTLTAVAAPEPEGGAGPEPGTDADRIASLLSDAVTGAFKALTESSTHDARLVTATGVGGCTRKAAYALSYARPDVWPVIGWRTPAPTVVPLAQRRPGAWPQAAPPPVPAAGPQEVEEKRLAHIGTAIHEKLVPALRQQFEDLQYQVLEEHHVTLASGPVRIPGRLDLAITHPGSRNTMVIDLKTCAPQVITKLKAGKIPRTYLLQLWTYAEALAQEGRNVTTCALIALDRAYGKDHVIVLPYGAAEREALHRRIAQLSAHATNPDFAPRDPANGLETCKDCPYRERCWSPAGGLPVAVEGERVDRETLAGIEASARRLVTARTEEADARSRRLMAVKELEHVAPGAYGVVRIDRRRGVDLSG
ncbi:PD-(D/E)XK nuclease family protein [Streptoverticillium reticulum]|uniref:PD-(D/E)XK nuclease family protein n=1 Tax=Streptoverticillium reticulum TaxID=1433415 RepID=UPI0039BF420F